MEQLNLASQKVDISDIDPRCNGAAVWADMLLDKEPHPGYPITGMVKSHVMYAQAFLWGFFNELEDGNSLKVCFDIINIKCSSVVEKAKENNIPYNLILQINKKSTKEIEVPVEKKVGLFKKETVMEKRTETVNEVADVTFDGWILDEFHIQGKVGKGPDIGKYYENLRIIYALGSDAKIYVLFCDYDQEQSAYNYTTPCDLQIFEAAPGFSPDVKFGSKMQLKFVYTGCLGAIDTDFSRDEHSIKDEIGEEMYFNFPFEYSTNGDWSPDSLFSRIENVLNVK